MRSGFAPLLLIQNPLHLIRVFMDIPLGTLWQIAVAEWTKCLALTVCLFLSTFQFAKLIVPYLWI